jgi:uncharacterized membrane protein
MFLFTTGGILYNLFEIFIRGWSHWTMFLLGGTCFVCLGVMNELVPWQVPMWKQMVAGAAMITYFEFLTGCVVNIWFGWKIWDYSGKPGNLIGQICPQFTLLWVLVSLIGIVLDDWLRYLMFGEERPHYRWF